METFNLEFSMKSLVKSNLILSALSFTGSLIVILFYLFKEKLRKYFVFSLVFYMSINELLFSVASIFSIYRLIDDNIYCKNNDNPICWIQASIISYTDLGSLIWISLISYYIHECFVNLNTDVIFQKKRNVILAGFCIPIIPMIL